MNSSKRFDAIRMAFAIVIALLISFVVILLVSKEPGEAIIQLLTGPLQSKRNFGDVVTKMIPLIFTGTGVCIMFSANQINLAGEGAFHMGGIVAACVALLVGLPSGLSIPVALLCAAVAGAIFTAIPALLKILTNSDVLVSSLMMNYLALWMATYIMRYFIVDAQLGSASKKIPAASTLTTMVRGTSVHTGIIIALVVAVLGYLFLFKSKLGYQLRITGENESFARYSGINIVKVIMSSQLIGGFVAGLGGGVELLGPVYDRFSWTSLLGYGWDAIIICTLAKNNPIYTPFAAFFLAYLRVGASVMARNTDVSIEIVQITQGIVILLVVAEQFLSSYKHKMIAKEAQAELKKGEA